ncbi:MAG: ABC transporter substrate-binding protein [Planctomycetota bacterium]
MKTSGIALILGLILAVLVGAPLAGRLLVERPGDAAEQLVVVTPHNEQIRYEMARGFNLWRKSQGLEAVRFDWRVGSGTSDLRTGVISQFHRQAKRGLVHEGIGVDLFFGGGTYEHGDKLINAEFELSAAWAAPSTSGPAVRLGQDNGAGLVIPSRSALRIELLAQAPAPASAEVVVDVARPQPDAEPQTLPDVPTVKLDAAESVVVHGLSMSLASEPAEQGQASRLVLTLRNDNVERFVARGVRVQGWPGFVEAGRPAVDLLMAVSAPPPGLSLDDPFFQTAFPQAELGGSPLYDPELRWVGVVLSSFGVVYNVHAYERLGLEPPTRWSDLARPELSHWVALANPSHSGSVRQAYNIALQRTGWNDGWWTLRRAFANARYFATSATKVPLDVSKRDAAAGLCIDFYGRFQASDSPGRVGYVDPWEPTPSGGRASLTFTEADPISMLRGAPNREVAGQFVRWLISQEGQLVWQLKAGAEGGPEQFELRRQPIRKDLYGPGQAAWTDRELDAFESARALPQGTPSYFGSVAAVSNAMAIDIHQELSSAWEAILAMRVRAEQDPALAPTLAEMERLFDAMPEELVLDWPDDDLAQHWLAIQNNPAHPRHQEVLDTLAAFNTRLRGLDDGPGGWEPMRRKWRDQFFRPNYLKIVELAGD